MHWAFTLRLTLSGLLACAGSLASSIGMTLTYPGQPAQAGSHPSELTASRSGSGINGLNQPFNWYVSASGDLVEGELKAKAQTFNASQTGAILTLTDRAFIEGPALTATTAVFEMDVDGHSSINPLCECFSGVSMIAYIRGDFGPNSIWQSSFDYAWNINNIGLGGSEFYKHDPQGDVEIRTDAKGAWDFTLRIAVPVFLDASGRSNPMNLTQYLQVAAAQSNQGSAAIDAWDTARLRVVLEEGYSLGSESGLLLTAAGTPVPEPASAGLFALGAVLLLGGHRFRRARQSWTRT